MFWIPYYERNSVLKMVRAKTMDFTYKELVCDYYRANWQEWLYPPEFKGSGEGYDYLFKILIVGDTDVGKTGFLFKFLEEDYSPFPPPEKEREFKTRVVFMHGKHVKLQLWEQANPKRTLRCVNGRSPYRQMNGVIVVFSVRNQKSFANVRHWVEDVRRFADNAEVMVVATHCDEIDENKSAREVSSHEIAESGTRLGVVMVETSGVDGVQVHLAVRLLAERIYARHMSVLPQRTPYLKPHCRLLSQK